MAYSSYDRMSNRALSCFKNSSAIVRVAAILWGRCPIPAFILSGIHDAPLVRFPTLLIVAASGP